MATTVVHVQPSYASLFQAKETNLEYLFSFYIILLFIFLKGQFTLEFSSRSHAALPDFKAADGGH